MKRQQEKKKQQEKAESQEAETRERKMGKYFRRACSVLLGVMALSLPGSTLVLAADSATKNPVVHVADEKSEIAVQNTYRSYSFDSPKENEEVTGNTFLFEGWVSTEKEITSIMCSINEGSHYVQAKLYEKTDVSDATAFRAQIDSDLLNVGDNDVALYVSFSDNTWEIIENRTVKRNPDLLLGYDYPSENMKITDNQFQFSGWIETSRKLESVVCSLNQGERYIEANLYTKSDVPNTYAFRTDILTSYLKYGDNSVSVCVYYADGTGETLATRKVRKCINDVVEFPKNKENYTCQDSSFTLQGWSTDDTKTIDHFEFTLNGKRYTMAAKSRSDLTGNAKGYQEEVSLDKLRNGQNRIHIFAYYTDGTLRNVGTREVTGELDHTWDAGKVTKEATCAQNGEKLYTCAVCKTTKTEEIPATGNHKNTELRNVKEATCTEEGYTGDTYCKDCGTKLSSGKAVARTEHQWDSGKITKEPTTAENGIRTFTCEKCGTTKTETVEKLEDVKDNTKDDTKNDIKLPSGVVVNDTKTNGAYKVLESGTNVEFSKPMSNKSTVTIPDQVTINGVTCTVTSISVNAFRNNKTVRKVIIGNNITNIGAYAFSGCSNLTKVRMGNNIAKIGNRAFYGCTRLSGITLPGTVKSIGKQAFYNCKKMKTIILKTSALTSKNIGSKAFARTYANAVVKVPAKRMKAYKKLLKSKGMSAKAIYKK